MDKRERMKQAIRDNPDDLDKAVDEIERVLETPPLSPWWYSKERLEALSRR